MNRTVLVGVVAGALVVGLGATLILLTGDGDTEPAAGQAAATSPTASSPDPTEEAGPPAGAAPSTTTATPGDPADDTLCQLHVERVQALDGHVPVQNSEDLMAVSEAQLAFYSQATDVLDPPERDAFAEFAEWETEKAAYHEELDWDPTPELDYALENLPSPPSDGALHVIEEVLEERCGLIPVKETPAQ